MALWRDSTIKTAVEHLQKGHVILYPTDTVWGIGCDATFAESIDRIHTLKLREKNRPYLVLVASIKMIKQYVEDVSPIAEELIRAAQQPTTFIFPKAKNLPQTLIAEDGSVGIRIPRSAYLIKLIKQFGKPVVSTSANLSGEDPPTSFMQISDAIKNEVDYIIPASYAVGSLHPSRIIRLQGKGLFEVLRD